MKEKFYVKYFDSVIDCDDYKVVSINKKEGLLSSDNREILPCIYDEVSEIINSNYVIVYMEVNNQTKCNLFDIKANVFLFDFIYDEINFLDSHNEEETLIEFSIDKVLYIYNLTANKIIFKADEYEIYFKRYIGVKKDSGYTLFDFKGCKLLENVTDFYSYKNTFLKVFINGHENYYDSESNELIFDDVNEKTVITEYYDQFIISLSKKNIQIYDVSDKMTVIFEGDYKFLCSELKQKDKCAYFVRVFNQERGKYSLVSGGNILEENLKDISIYDNIIVCIKDDGYITYYDCDKLLGISHEFDKLKLEKTKYTNCGVIILDDFQNKKSYLVNTGSSNYVKTDMVDSIEYKCGTYDLIKLGNGYNIYDYNKNEILLDKHSFDIKFFIDLFRTHNHEAADDANKYAFIKINDLYYVFDLNMRELSLVGYKNYLSVIGKYSALFKTDDEENKKSKLVEAFSGEVIGDYDEINIYYQTFIVTKNNGVYSLANLYPYNIILEYCDSIIIEDGIVTYQKDGITNTYNIFSLLESKIPLLVKGKSSDHLLFYNGIYFEKKEDIDRYQRQLKK